MQTIQIWASQLCAKRTSFLAQALPDDCSGITTVRVTCEWSGLGATSPSIAVWRAAWTSPQTGEVLIHVRGERYEWKRNRWISVWLAGCTDRVRFPSHVAATPENALAGNPRTPCAWEIELHK